MSFVIYNGKLLTEMPFKSPASCLQALPPSPSILTACGAQDGRTYEFLYSAGLHTDPVSKAIQSRDIILKELFSGRLGGSVG